MPEIYDGIVEIKGVARKAGERSKIAVESIDRRIDAVGACVGMKGVRIQAVVRELNNEKIDIINFSSEPELFISRAMAPAKPTKVIVNNEDKIAAVIVPDDQISLAIGRGGVNMNLVTELTGYQVEPIRESEYQREGEALSIDIEDIEELPDSLKTKLIDGNLFTDSEVLDAGKEGLLELSGVGPKSADKIWEIIQKNLPEEEPGEDDEDVEEE